MLQRLQLGKLSILGIYNPFNAKNGLWSVITFATKWYNISILQYPCVDSGLLLVIQNTLVAPESRHVLLHIWENILGGFVCLKGGGAPFINVLDVALCLPEWNPAFQVSWVCKILQVRPLWFTIEMFGACAVVATCEVDEAGLSIILQT